MLKKKERIFRFKKFEVVHSRSAHKVGVDGVLVGAWADITGCMHILDAGTGCGLIALMCAQRTDNTKITAVDIDPESAEEAAWNFINSPWKERLNVFCGDICQIAEKSARPIYDLIVSNPPFFDDGVDNLDTPRLIARHSGFMSPITLIRDSKKMLKNEGRLVMIFPYSHVSRIIETAEAEGFFVSRRTDVRGHKNAEKKRTLLELKKSFLETNESEIITDILDLEDKPGIPSEEYRRLCSEFYLKF